MKRKIIALKIFSSDTDQSMKFRAEIRLAIVSITSNQSFAWIPDFPIFSPVFGCTVNQMAFFHTRFNVCITDDSRTRTSSERWSYVSTLVQRNENKTTHPSENNAAFNWRVNEKPINGRFLPLKPSFTFMKSSIRGPLDSDSNSSKFDVSSMLLIVGT